VNNFFNYFYAIEDLSDPRKLISQENIRKYFTCLFALAIEDLFSMKRVAIPYKINDSVVEVFNVFPECIRACQLHKNAEVKVKNQIA
jgi:hypothetical protein